MRGEQACLQEPHHKLAVQLLVYQDLDVCLIAPLFIKQLLLDHPGCASSVPLYVPENILATPPPAFPLGPTEPLPAAPSCLKPQLVSLDQLWLLLEGVIVII